MHKGCADQCVLTFPEAWMKTVEKKAEKKAVKKARGAADKKVQKGGLPAKKKNKKMLASDIVKLEQDTGHAQQLQAVHLPQGAHSNYGTPPHAQPQNFSVPSSASNGMAPPIHGTATPTSAAATSSNTTTNPHAPPPMDAIFIPGVLPRINNEMLQYQSLKNNARAPVFSSIQELVASTPKTHIILAVKRVETCFPECHFFHIPSIDTRLADVNPILLGALLGVCSFFTPFKYSDAKTEFNADDKWLGVNSFQVKNSLYEKLALDAIFSNMLFLKKPDIEICQALILLSCVKWGHNDYFSAWMLHGCGSRLVQALQFDERFQQKCKQSPLLNELRNRTFWSAFCLDRIISTGENRCFMINNYEDVELPLPDSYFFGLQFDNIGTPSSNLSANRNNYNEGPFSADVHTKPSFLESQARIAAANDLQLKSRVTIASFNSFYRENPLLIFQNERSVFLKSYSLWGLINEYMMQGGRAKKPNEVPWDLENSTVGRITKEVEEFWSVLPNEWKWPNIDYANQRKQQTKRIFIIATINCLYCLTIIFCVREYFPFLPSKEQGICGPTEPPYLPKPPYPEYWVDMSRKCFSALRELCEILEVIFETESKITRNRTGLDSNTIGDDINLTESSPFFSFCAFVCAIQCNYGTNFPFMDPDSSYYNRKSGKSLSHCFKVMLKILKSREHTCPVTKNWLYMVYRVQEIYRSVANNKVTVSKTQKDTVSQTNSNVENGHVQTHNYAPTQHIQSSSGLQRQDNYQLQGQAQVQAQNSQNYGSSMQQNHHIPPELVTNSINHGTVDSSALNKNNTNSTIINSDSDTIFNTNIDMPRNSNHFPAPYGNTSDITSGTSSNPNSTPRNPIDLEPDTDKLSLLFSDQEFEMLMQFSS